MKIVIVGGGTAGWLVSLYLAHTRPQHQYITVDSAVIGPIGVGEAATGKFNQLLEECGIDIMDFMRETDALPKHALRFVNWAREPGQFDSPLEYSVSCTNPVDSRLYLQLLKGRPIEHASVSGLYTTQNKTTYQLVEGALVKTHDHALQFDALKTASVLKRHAINRGVQHISDTIVEVVVDDSGVNSLIMQSGETLSGDLFIDCSGLARLLIGRLDPGFKDASDYVHVDSAMLFRLPQDQRPKRTVGVSIARQHGWNFEISTRNRIGSGYVHNSSRVTQDQLIQELSQAYGQTVEPVRTIRWQPGALRKTWVKNTIAMGLSACFLEPLQTGSIHDTICQVKYLVETALLDTKEQTLAPCVINSYNQLCERLFDDFLDFLSVSYAGKKESTEFWQWITHERKLTDRANMLLELAKHRLPCDLDFDKFLGYCGAGIWNYTLAGLSLIDRKIVASSFKAMNIDVDHLNQQQLEFEQHHQTIISKCLTSEQLNTILL